MSDRPLISAVIRSLDEERHIGRLLTGIAAQTVPVDDVVLVDSGSTDATVSIAARFPNVRVVTIEPGRFSFGRSLNIGCEAAQGELIVIASAHVYPVFDTWIERLIEPFADDQVALSYGRQMGDEHTKLSEAQVLRRWFPPTSTAIQGDPFCNNANAAIRRGVWASTPYDEDLTGLEDLDWARRVADAGHRISYVAEAPVVHVHEETWAQIANRYRREAIAHRTIVPEQRLRAGEAVALAATNIASDLVVAARQGVLAEQAWGVVRFRVAQFSGTYRGFHQRGPVTATLKRRFYYPHTGTDHVPRAPAAGQPIDYSAPHGSAPAANGSATMP
jgi:GT2 family glycosyltransferase